MIVRIELASESRRFDWSVVALEQRLDLMNGDSHVQTSAHYKYPGGASKASDYPHYQVVTPDLEHPEW